VRWSFLPPEPYFFAAFVSMTGELRRGVALLLEMLDSRPPRVELQPRIHEVENACDTIAHEIIQRLNRTFVTPIDREDVLALATALDDVMDAIDDASAIVPLHRVAHVRDGAADLVRIVAAQIEQLATAAVRLPKFRGDLMTAVREIKRLEEQADGLHKKLVGELFDQEGDAIEVMKWKEIFDFLEAASDRAEQAAHVIESV